MSRAAYLLAASAVFCVNIAFSSPASSEEIQKIALKRADGSEITAYLEGQNGAEKMGIMLILQGSMCGSVAPTGNDRLGYTVPRKLVRLDIEKYGISPTRHGDDSKPCPTDYLAHNTVDQRVYDVMQTIAFLRNHAPWWNGRLYMLGTSEGATIASLSGPLIPEMKGIVLINGSIGRPFRDGWADAMVASVAAQGGSSSDQADARKEAESTWEKVRANPTPNQQAFGNGNTYLWWSSIIDKVPSNILLQSDQPILLMQSEFDEMTPISSARALKKSFADANKSNLTYVELPGLTHGLRTKDGKPGWEPVMAQVSKWISKIDK